MKRRLLGSIAALGLAFAAGCAPTVTGAACLADCNCPSAQRCAKNPDGGAGLCIDGANYCGKDAGPALFGTLTLNGGAPKPSGNAASVLGWDHNPTLFDDGGFEPPLVTVPVDSDGNWEIDQGDEGTTYYLAGVYSLNATRSTASLPAAATANGQPLDVDVPTYLCLAWTELAQPSTGQAMPFLAGLVADVPDVTNGNELTSATVKASDSVRNNFTLTLAPHPENPFAPGKWAWTPTALTPLVAGPITFTISGMGYSAGTKCIVTTSALETLPSITMVPNPWVTNIAQTITFTPPAQAQATLLSIADLNGNPVALPSNLSVIPHGMNSAPLTLTFPASTLGAAICPENGKQCILTLLSVHTTLTGNTGVNEATALATAPFNTKTN